MYFDAVSRVGDPKDHDAIGVAIGHFIGDTVAGPISFDPVTHLAKHGDDGVPVSFWQLWDGERTMFLPDGYAAGDFRRPPWMSTND